MKKEMTISIKRILNLKPLFSFNHQRLLIFENLSKLFFWWEMLWGFYFHDQGHGLLFLNAAGTNNRLIDPSYSKIWADVQVPTSASTSTNLKQTFIWFIFWSEKYTFFTDKTTKLDVDKLFFIWNEKKIFDFCHFAFFPLSFFLAQEQHFFLFYFPAYSYLPPTCANLLGKRKQKHLQPDPYSRSVCLSNLPSMFVGKYSNENYKTYM